MSYRSYGSSRRKKRAAFYLIALLLLAALVFGAWMLLLAPDAPLAKRLGRRTASQTTPEPAVTPAATVTVVPAEPTAPEATMPSTEPDATAEPTAAPAVTPTAEPTAEPLPTPTPAVTPLPTDAPTAEPTQAPTAEPTQAPTAEPAATPQVIVTDIPSATQIAAATDAPASAPASRSGLTIADLLAGTTKSPTDSEEITVQQQLTTPVPTATAAAPETTPGPTPEATEGPTPVPTSRYPLPGSAPPVNQQVSNRQAEQAIYGTSGNDLPTAPPDEIPADDENGESARVSLTSATGTLNIRSAPNGTVIGSLPNGTAITVLGYSGNWAHIRANGREGYVSRDFIKLDDSSASAAPAEGSADQSAGQTSSGLMYSIEVDRGAQVVRVYTIGEDGEYSILAREMICSTDIYEQKPPNGTYQLNGEKLRWLITYSGTYAQYATRITGHILFHSVPYAALSGDTLLADEYKKLGKNVSIGCVRLLCADAKWIYDNIPEGTVVKFVTGEMDEEKLKELAAPELAGGKWDPTDDNPDNPDYKPDYKDAHPFATPYPNVTPAPTEPWTPDTYE